MWGPRDASRSPAATGTRRRQRRWRPRACGTVTSPRPDGAFTVTSDGLAEPLKVPASHRSELRALLALRDTARSLLAAEASTLEDTAEIAELRSQLGGRYRDYQRRYGPINRFTLRRTGRTDPATGEERMARVTPTAVRLLRSDPFAALVQALENFDETTQTATPPESSPDGSWSPRPAARRRHAAGRPRDLLETRGRVDLARSATSSAPTQGRRGRSWGSSSTRTRRAAAWCPGRVPVGNVRVKLEHARKPRSRPELEGNVRALSGCCRRI